MRHKLILMLLTVFVVGSIAGITAFNSLQEDKAAAVGKAKIDTKLALTMGTSPSYTPSNPLSQMDGALRDKDGKGLGDKKITITTSKGKTIIATTNRGGEFTRDIPVGETITVKFDGDNKYNPTEVSFYLRDTNDPKSIKS